jgi:hypothetical protein
VLIVGLYLIAVSCAFLYGKKKGNLGLGTTYSYIAYVDDTGRPVVLKSAVGEHTMPSGDLL